MTPGTASATATARAPSLEGAAPSSIVTAGLTKRFGSGQVAVDHIDLDVPSGSVYGFLGPNGSGKTTTIRMLLGLVAPTVGTVRLLGGPMPASRASVLPRIGALVEGPAFHPYLSGRDNLVRVDAGDRTVDSRTCKTRVDAALDRVGLTAAAGKRYRVYSLGMRQRLGLAAALLRPRDLLVLDEPTNGLDPQGTREVRALVRELAADGTTVFLSTHLLAEVEQICTHVGVMSTGRLVAQGALKDVTAGAVTRLRVECREPARASTVLEGLGLQDVQPTPDGVTAVPGTTDLEQVLAELMRAGVGVREFATQRATLEDLFVSLTGEGFDVRQ